MKTLRRLVVLSVFLGLFAACAPGSETGIATPTEFTANKTTSDTSLRIDHASVEDDDFDLQKFLDDAEASASPEGKRILQTGRAMISDGVIVIGSCWDYIDSLFKRAGFTSKTIATVYASKQAGPYADSNTIQAGDWLYFINQSYGNVEHSGIFVGWIDFEKKTALILSYPGESRQVPGRYSSYDLSLVYNIMRGKVGVVSAPAINQLIRLNII